MPVPAEAIVVVVAAIGITGVLLSAFGGGSGKLFAKKQFLTRNELEFLNRLERALPELRVHSQVAMGAILRPSTPSGGGRGQRRRYMSTRGRFAQKICDYVLQDRDSGEIVAIVELDDRTHDPERDHRRDAMLNSAGYRTIRFHSRHKPTYEQIRATVLETG